MLWMAAVTIAIVFILVTKVGPRVLALAPTHGVHLGDLAAIAACGSSAYLASVQARQGEAVPVRSSL